MELTGQTAFDLYASKKEEPNNHAAICVSNPEDHKRRLQAAAQLAKVHVTDLPPGKFVVDLGAGFMDLHEHLVGTPLEYRYLAVEEQGWMIDRAFDQDKFKYSMPSYAKSNLLDWLMLNPKKPVAAFALGVVATFTSVELEIFGDLVRKSSIKRLILSWQGFDEYSGSFQKWARSEIVEAFGNPVEVKLIDTEWTGVFYYD